MAIVKTSDAVVLNGKTIRPAMYDVDQVNKIKITLSSVEDRISRLQDEISKWQAIKSEIEAIET